MNEVETQAGSCKLATFGPSPQQDGCLFRLWARPGANIELVVEDGSPQLEERGGPQHFYPMRQQADGMYEAHVPGAGPGTRYWFKVEGAGPFPDLASRYQPSGVHGPSQVVAQAEGMWDTDEFTAPALRDLVVYEMHVGTFTPAGKFLSVIEKLDGLQKLGINGIELMPIADFAGDYNWGYDGVSLYAPAHSYGTPDDLRTLIREAHRRGIAVYLDVVYNHLGPDGAYHSTFAPKFYSGKHKTPWGDGLNFDGEGRDKVRDYFIESALSWICEYHVDGLRVDATHAILDDSKPHFLTELTERVRAASREIGREVFIIAEDERNERKVVLPAAQGGHGFDAVWSDDFHHHMRHRMAGDSDGYFRDFDGTAPSIAKTIENGWFFTGQFSRHGEHARGTSPEGLPHQARVFCIQNHDQIGNRAFGERLSTQISPQSYLAASALLLLAPEVPLLFMGQEWAAAEPFQYFTNHNEELGRLITEGRRKEFEHFAAFADESRRESIPDPQAPATFLRSKLDWSARETPEHLTCLKWYRALLQIRKKLLDRAEFQSANAAGNNVVLVKWASSAGQLIAAIALDGPADASYSEWKDMTPVLASEDREYGGDPGEFNWKSSAGHLKFNRAGAVLLASGDLVQDAGNGTE